jgi:ADP-heptose:LPS heptosyltransferase
MHIAPKKKLGIWMDHAHAHLTEYAANPVTLSVIESAFTHEDKNHALKKSENLMHNQEQHLQADYYKQLGEVILAYDNVLLFGPTDAKAELLTILRADHRFEKITIEVLPTDKMTEHEQHVFVQKHFTH